MSSFSSGTLCDITAGISCIIFLITVLQVRHMAPLTVSSGVSVGDDSSGEIINQWPPVQTTTGANLYIYVMSHWSKFHVPLVKSSIDTITNSQKSL